MDSCASGISSKIQASAAPRGRSGVEGREAVVTSARVLVTGAAGFIGRPAVDALRARDLEVHAVSSRRLTTTHPGITWHQADLLDPASLALIVDRVRATHLLHLAWDMRPGAWAAAGRHLDWLRASLGSSSACEAGGTES
jgi:NAD(P)-dependent dehydrogenase (short-subunit alcohol dehydrogenase family)